MGMHVLGLRDVVMKRADVEADGFDIVEVIRYLARGEKPIDDGHVLADLDGPRFQAFTQDSADGIRGKSHAQSLRTFEAGEHAGHRRDELIDRWMNDSIFRRFQCSSLSSCSPWCFRSRWPPGAATPRTATPFRAPGCRRRPNSAGKLFPDEVRKTIKLVVKDDKYTVTVGKAGRSGDRQAEPGGEAEGTGHHRHRRPEQGQDDPGHLRAGRRHVAGLLRPQRQEPAHGVQDQGGHPAVPRHLPAGETLREIRVGAGLAGAVVAQAPC